MPRREFDRFKKVITRLNQNEGRGGFGGEATTLDPPTSQVMRANRALAALDEMPLPPKWGAASQQPTRSPYAEAQRSQPPLRVVPPSPSPPPFNPKATYAPHLRQAPPPPPAQPAAPARPSMTFKVPMDSVVAPLPAPPPPQAPRAHEGFGPVPAAATQGKVIVMFGCRGGAGTTTLSVNVASSLVRAGKSVCLLDLDLQLGDVFVALDLQAETSIAALAREAATIDGAALKRRLARHDSGVYALTQTGRLDDIDPELVERMPALLTALCQQFDYVVVDGVRDFGDYALSVLDMADEIALVLTQDVAAVRRAARVVTLFRRLGYGDAKLRLVLNRTSRKAQVSGEEIQRALHLPIVAAVRNDFQRLHTAFNEGALVGEVARSSGVAKDLAQLAYVLAGPLSPTAGAAALVPQKKGLFSFLRREGR